MTHDCPCCKAIIVLTPEGYLHKHPHGGSPCIGSGLTPNQAQDMLDEKIETPSSKKSTMRRFVMNREKDASGTSGVGVVAEGVEFSNGQVSIHWLSQLESVNVYANAKVLNALHGHSGGTTIEWIDP